MKKETLNNVLQDLKKPNVIVILKNDYEEDRFMTIGADSRYEHELTPLAIEFKERLIKHIENLISRLNHEAV